MASATFSVAVAAVSLFRDGMSDLATDTTTKLAMAMNPAEPRTNVKT